MNKKNPEYFLNFPEKKNKKFKAICVVLDYSKPNFFSWANHVGRHFFKPCPPPLSPHHQTILL